MAEQLGATAGDEVTVVSPYFDQGTLTPRAKKFYVSGTLSTGMYEYDSKYSLIEKAEAASFFRLPEKSATSFRIKTKDANQSYHLVAKLKQSLGFPYVARDWTELNKNLLYAIRLQKIVIFIVLAATLS